MSSLLRALSVLGAGAAGYVKGARMRQADDEAQADREFKNEERDFQRGERQRTLKVRAEMSAAAAPRAVEPNIVQPTPIGSRDVAPAADTLGQQGFAVGGKVFPDQAAAQAFAEEQNSPTAQMQRQVGVLNSNGEFMQAHQLRSAARQDELGGLQLSEAHRKVLNQKFDDDLNAKVNSFDDLAGFITSSKGDGQGGALQVKTQISPDGKTVGLYAIGPDGVAKPTPYNFSNDAAGLQRAKALLSKSATISDKLTHLHQQATEAQAANQLAESGRHNKAMEGIAGDKTAAQIEIATMRANASAANRAQAAELAQMKGAGSAFDRMDEVDKLTIGALNKQRDLITGEIVKARASGLWDDSSPNARALATQLATLDLKAGQIAAKYSSGTTAPDPLGLRGGKTGPSTKEPPPLAGGEPKAEQPSVMGFIGDRVKAAMGSGVAPAAPASPVAAPPTTYTPEAAARLEAQLQAENAEMGATKRVQYSPEVQAYVQSKRAVQDAQEQAQSDAYRAREFERAQRMR